MIERHIILYLVFILFLMGSCENSVQDMALKSPGANTKDDPQNTEQFFTITNEFQDHRGSGPLYIHLQSVDTGQTYVVPPTKYVSQELEYVIMDIKVEGECIKIPAGAFPVAVGVCESSECTKVRSLDVLLKNPAHYNINGIGGLLTPQINPVSPCSPEFTKLVESVGEYTQL